MGRLFVHLRPTLTVAPRSDPLPRCCPPRSGYGNNPNARSIVAGELVRYQPGPHHSRYNIALLTAGSPARDRVRLLPYSFDLAKRSLQCPRRRVA